MTIALNAAPIIAARLKGLKPADMVCVSLVGSLCNRNPVVHCKPSESLDWRWVKDLDVCLYVGPSPDWADTLKAIALCRPAHLSIWNTSEHWGAKVYLIPTANDIKLPVPQWEYELDIVEWLDFQNQDFLAGREYRRNDKGMPYAAD